MNHYAVLNAAGNVLQVNTFDVPQADSAANGWVELTTFSGWPNQADGWVVQVHDGQLVAVDARPLDKAKTDQVAILQAAYDAAISVPVYFTAATSVSKLYQCDPDSRQKLADAMLGCQAAQATPATFFWVPVDNTHVPFTYADLQGLATAIFAQGAPAFAKLQTLKAQVAAAVTNSQVEAITWASI